MYKLNVDSGIRMDLVRCDGDKGMEGLPNQFGCSFHKFGNFRKRRKLNGGPVPAFIRGSSNDKGPHPGLALYQNACREMVTVGQKYWLDKLVEKHGDPSQETVFRCYMYIFVCVHTRVCTCTHAHTYMYMSMCVTCIHAHMYIYICARACREALNKSLREIGLAAAVKRGLKPNGEITNSTVEGPNNRLKIEGLKDMTPIAWLHTLLAVERDYWTRELELCLAWVNKMVRL